MRVYSFDWATKRALTYYNSQTQKVKQIPNSIEEFEKRGRCYYISAKAITTVLASLKINLGGKFFK